MTLKEFFEATKKRHRLTLIAGETGIYSIVKWIYLLEDLKNISFIRTGDLILTTGLANNYDTWLEELVYAMKGKRISGIIFNTGRYINEIPVSLIDYCNEIGLPLFTMPWEIHIADVMQDCCNAVMKEQQRDDYFSKTFANAMFSNTIDPTFISEYEESATQLDFTYGIIALKNAVPEKVMAILNPIESKYLLLANKGLHYIVLYHVTEASFHKTMSSIHSSLAAAASAYGISTLSHSIRALHTQRNEAANALKVAIATKKSYCFYHDLGLYQLVLGISDESILQNLYTQKLKPIVDYDQKHNTNYLQILRYYIECNSSVQLVAEQTFTHRNTINYRIAKIKTLLHSDLSSMEERCLIQMALCYYDLLQ